MNQSFRRAAKRTASVAALGVIAVTQSACSYIQAQARVDPQTVAYYNPGRMDLPRDPDALGPPRGPCPVKLAADTHSGAINLDCFRFPEDNDVKYGASDQTAYRRVATGAVDDGTRVLRNRLGAILIKKSDDICTLELGRLVANEGTANAALTTLDSFFSTAATIVTGEQAKSILSGLAGAANTGRTTLRAEVYRNALSTAIARAITNERAKQMAGIQQKLTKGTADYTVDQMIVDVNAYHQICSFYRGIGLVNDAVDAAKPPTNPAADASATAIQYLDEEIAGIKEDRDNAKAVGTSTTELDAQLTNLQAQRAKLVATRADQLSTLTR
jgi:hypothetical protein